MNKLTLLLFTLGFAALLLLPELPGCNEIIKTRRWCGEHQKIEHLWIIEGHEYLVQLSPDGHPEIVGLDTRFHDN